MLYLNTKQKQTIVKRHSRLRKKAKSDFKKTWENVNTTNPKQMGLDSDVFGNDVKVYKIQERFLETPNFGSPNPLQNTIRCIEKNAIRWIKGKSFACFQYTFDRKLVAVPTRSINKHNEAGIITYNGSLKGLTWFVLQYRSRPNFSSFEYKYYTKQGRYVYSLESLLEAIDHAHESLMGD